MKLADIDALKQTFCAECDHSIKCEDCDIDYHFEHLAPTVDAVEVVRCKDCKKYIPCQKLPIGTSKWCGLFDRATCEMNYCGWGERKEDEIEMLPTQMSGRGER